VTTPKVVAEELEQALRIIAALPGAGTPYSQSPVAGVRRVYLRRVDAHLYYTFDSSEVIISRSPGGARRGAWSAAVENTPWTVFPSLEVTDGEIETLRRRIQRPAAPRASCTRRGPVDGTHREMSTPEERIGKKAAGSLEAVPDRSVQNLLAQV